jgi:hypothetical protein
MIELLIRHMQDLINYLGDEGSLRSITPTVSIIPFSPNGFNFDKTSPIY